MASGAQTLSTANAGIEPIASSLLGLVPGPIPQLSNTLTSDASAHFGLDLTFPAEPQETGAKREVEERCNHADIICLATGQCLFIYQ